jgi:Na+/H+ antiporter NhaD/arsenite permease-like protein
MQAWWIEPILSRLSDLQLFGGALTLSMFNDNAAITYLGTLVPEFGEHQRYLLVSGAVIGGGLTVIANAPNPAGLSILSKHFAKGVAPLSLFLGALGPTILIAAIFYIF